MCRRAHRHVLGFLTYKIKRRRSKSSDMPNLGLDVGAAKTKAAIMDNGKVIALASVLTGFDQSASAEAAIKAALEKAGIDRQSLNNIRATGVGRKAVADITANEINELAAAAKGTSFLIPSARTVIDAGAEEARAVKLDNGNVKDFAVNEKCAAGAGSFTESMAKALQMSLEDFANASLKSDKKIPMNAQCVIFAESEVVSLIHSGASKQDISRSVHDAIADRISAVARRVGLAKDVVLIGGMGYNVGFVDALKRAIEMDVLVPPDPDYVGAIGAAILD